MSAEEFGGIIRAIAAGAGGYLVGKGWIDEPTMMAIVGAVATIGVAVWSVFAKRKAAPK